MWNVENDKGRRYGVGFYSRIRPAYPRSATETSNEIHGREQDLPSTFHEMMRDEVAGLISTKRSLRSGTSATMDFRRGCLLGGFQANSALFTTTGNNRDVSFAHLLARVPRDVEMGALASA